MKRKYDELEVADIILSMNSLATEEFKKKKRVTFAIDSKPLIIKSLDVITVPFTPHSLDELKDASYLLYSEKEFCIEIYGEPSTWDLSLVIDFKKIYFRTSNRKSIFTPKNYEQVIVAYSIREVNKYLSDNIYGTMETWDLTRLEVPICIG